MQPRAVVERDAIAELALQDLERVVERQPQLVDANLRHFALGDEFGRVQRQLAAGADDHSQVRRSVEHQVADRVVQGLGWQPLGIVEHHDGRRGQSGHFREQRRQQLLLTPRLACRFGDRDETRATGRYVQRGEQRFGETPRRVPRVERQPGDKRAAFEPGAPPLGQQGGLAEAARRLDQDRCAFVQVVPAAHQCALQHSRARQARRRRLKDELRLMHRDGAQNADKRIRSRRIGVQVRARRGDRLCCAGCAAQTAPAAGRWRWPPLARSPGRIGRGGRSPPALRGQRTLVTRYLASLKTTAREKTASQETLMRQADLKPGHP